MPDQQHQAQLDLLQRLRASGNPKAQHQAQELQTLYHDREMAGLASDCYDSARNDGHPPTGWLRVSENPQLLAKYAAQMDMSAEKLRNMLKPDDSGFRAEIYVPDPTVLGPGYKPVLAFKGSGGEVATTDGKPPHDVTKEDFLANNFPQSVGMQTDYYDRAMKLASQLKLAKVDFEATGHSLAGGMASAASAVTGVRATTWNAAGLHPLTAQRFAKDNGLPTYDVSHRITAYQVQGELLNNGIQENLSRLDVAKNQELGTLIQQATDLARSLPQTRALMQRELIEGLPRPAQETVTAFVNKLATGDTQRMLRELPLAAGQPQPLAAYTGRPGQHVEREHTPTLQELMGRSGPLLEIATATAMGAHAGRYVGEGVAYGGTLAEQGTKMVGGGVRQAGALSGQATCAVTQTGSTIAQGSQGVAGAVLATGREAVGHVQAAAAQGATASSASDSYAQAGMMRLASKVLPDAWGGARLRESAERQEQSASAMLRAGTEAAERSRSAGTVQADAIRGATREIQTRTGQAADAACQAQERGGAQAGQWVARPVEASGQRVRELTSHAPAVGATIGGVAGLGVSTAAELRPENMPRLASAAGVVSQGSGAVAEALSRHSMPETVTPSIEERVKRAEQAASMLLPQQQPSQTPKNDAPTQPQDKTRDPRYEGLMDRLNRMIDAADRGDWSMFRQDQQTFAAMAPGRDQQAASVAQVNMEERQIAQQQLLQQQTQQQETQQPTRQPMAMRM